MTIREPSLEIAIVQADGCIDPGASTALVPWWSFTKTLIAVAALRLSESGLLDLDAIVDSTGSTLRHILRHRAGLGDYGGLPDYHAAVERGDDPWSEAEFLARVPPDRRLFAPDTGFAYSNIGYQIAGRAIERAYGADLGDALSALVLAPLGLPRPRIAKTRADMRATAFAGGQDYDPGWVFHRLAIGSVSDAAAALHRILTGDLLTTRSRAALIEACPVGGPVAGRPWVEPGYGLGVMIGKMSLPGMSDPALVCGHSAGGPGSVGAVYHLLSGDAPRTVAVFSAGDDLGHVERAALACLLDARRG